MAKNLKYSGVADGDDVAIATNATQLMRYAGRRQQWSRKGGRRWLHLPGCRSDWPSDKTCHHYVMISLPRPSPLIIDTDGRCFHCAMQTPSVRSPIDVRLSVYPLSVSEYVSYILRLCRSWWKMLIGPSLSLVLSEPNGVIQNSDRCGQIVTLIHEQALLSWKRCNMCRLGR